MSVSTELGAALLAAVAIAGCSSGVIDAPGQTGQPAGHTLAWRAPTTNADGTPLLDLAGYKLHYDTTSRGGDARHAYAHVIDLGPSSCAPVAGGDVECHAEMPNLDGPSGTRYFLTVTAYDRAAPPNESAYSNELEVVLP